MTEGRRRVLVVEDSDTQAFKLEALLNEAGYIADRTASAEGAIDYLQGARPDLVIVDYHLPGRSGAELCRQLRMRPGVESIPVLMLTDDAQTDVERKGLESGADDYVRKSAGDDVLIARVASLLRASRARSPLTAASSDYFRSQTILVIDDSPTYLAFLESELEQEGYKIIAAGLPKEALALIESQHNDAMATPRRGAAGIIDCIVLDLVMPGMDGIELCGRLNDLRRSVHLFLPILMVTSHDSKDEMMRALEAGADDFVKKSNDTVILKARIRALLRRKMLHDEHERILSEFRNKELEVVQARAEQKAAQARAALVEELERANADLKRAQAQLVHSVKMAALGELVAGVAHEVNNPLAYSLAHLRTIAGSLKLIAPETKSALPPKSQRKLEKAEQRSRDAIDGLERVEALIVKLRKFSRLDEGDFKNADIRECIEATLPIVRHRIHGGVKVETAYEGGAELYCAPGLLNQVILNLVTNALDAVGPEGEIRIATRRSNGWFSLSVADTGPGIAENARERLFEPFFTTKEIGQGTGLGLAISYQIVESHFGRIEARNRTEGGAEFVVHLPTDIAERNDASKSAAR